MNSLPTQSAYLAYMNSAQRASLFKDQGHLPVSQSGSETDVSTSTETLSQEERYVLAHTQRQDPQGEETSRSLDASSCNTLIIHHSSLSSDLWTSRCSNIHEVQDPGPPSYLAEHQLPYEVVGSRDKDSSCLLKMNASQFGGMGRGVGESGGSGVQEISDIPESYLDQSEVLKHLCKEVKINASPTSQAPSQSSGYGSDQEKGGEKGRAVVGPTCLPPPAYPRWRVSEHGGNAGAAAAITSRERVALSQSQPDLSRLGVGATGAKEEEIMQKIGLWTRRPKTKGRASVTSQKQREQEAEKDTWPPSEMVEILMRENSALKLELENCYHKVACMQKFELELSKVHQAHEGLVKSCERRENLERTARARLQVEVRRLQEEKRDMKNQMELLAAQFMSRPLGNFGDEAFRKEINRRDVLIAQLISQNKEIAAAKERQDIELAAQRATLQEQRTHIDILDNALTNAQTNVVRLEEECRKKQLYVERASQLQRALASLQLSSDRREQTERKLRQQLEREIKELRNQLSNSSGGGGGKGSTDRKSSSQETAELKRHLRAQEERTMTLEGEVTKWEQRYLEESAIRQAAIDAASIPKDARIAALEQTSQESEKLMAESRSEKIRHMDELHQAQKRVAEAEARAKALESKLAEKDAMIRVLQKHAYSDKDGVGGVGRSPQHTPHPSLVTASSSSSTSGAVGAGPKGEMGSPYAQMPGRAKLSTSSLGVCSDPPSSSSLFSAVTSVLTSLPLPVASSSSPCSSGRPSISSSSVSDPLGISSSSGFSSTALNLAYASATGIPSTGVPTRTSPMSSSLSSVMKFAGLSSSVSGVRREGETSFDNSNKSLDDQLKELDSQLLSKDSLIQALRREKEKYPSHYWRV